MLQNQFLNFSY